MKADKIFISYSRTDSAFIIKLEEDLARAGIFIWLDQKMISGGKIWDVEVEKALEASMILIVVVSPKSASSDNVANEVQYAREEGKIIVPVLIEQTKIPLNWRRYQRIDFIENYEAGLNNLIQTIKYEKSQMLNSEAEKDEQRLKEEAVFKAKAEEEQGIKAEAEAKQMAEAEDKRIEEEKDREELLLKEREEAKAEEEKRIKAEAKRKRLEEQRIKAETQARRIEEEKRIEEELRLKKEAEANRKIEDEQRLKKEDEAKQKAKIERRIRVEAEAIKIKDEKVKEELRLKAEAKTKHREEEEKGKKEQTERIDKKEDSVEVNIKITETSIQKILRYKMPLIVAGVIAVLVIVIGIIYIGYRNERFLSGTEQTFVIQNNNLEENAWKDALSLNTIESYKAYLQDYKDGIHFNEAQNMINKIVDNNDWQNASELKTKEAFKNTCKNTGMDHI